jgi:hypothetical protein
LRFLIDLLIAIGIAVVVGFGSAALVLDRDRLFGAQTRGAWTAWPNSGSPDADPYTIALLARSGEVPLGAGEGLAFIAEADSAGGSLYGGCRYILEGQTPPARLWTLTLYDGEGHLLENPVHRTGFHSREIERRADGSFDIALAPDAQPGNWLPVTTKGPIKLMLRLYDTPIAGGANFGNLTLPSIRKGDCS